MSHSGIQTKKSGTNFYAAFFCLPREKREALEAVYAFCRHSDDIVDEEPDVARAQADLEAWREELDACFRHEPKHPVMQDLLRYGLDRFPLPREHFDAILDGCEMDLHVQRYPTYADLIAYCERVASAVGLLCIEIFEYEDPRTREYARELGLALQLTNILRDVARDAERHRIYLPLEDLEWFGVTEAELLESRPGERFRDLMEFGAERAEGLYASARHLGSEVWTPNLLPAEVMGHIYHRILHVLKQTGYDVYKERPRVPTLTKFRIALSLYVRTRFLGKSPWPEAASS